MFCDVVFLILINLWLDTYEQHIFHNLEKCFESIRRQRWLALNLRYNRSEMERLSIRGDKNIAYRISRNLAYGQFGRRFSCGGTTRAHQGCVLRDRQVIEYGPDDQNSAKFCPRKTSSTKSILPFQTFGKALNIDDDLVKQLFTLLHTSHSYLR